MAAPNFCKFNASRYFCMGRNAYIDQEAIDANGWSQDMLGQFDELQTQFDYECAKDHLMDELKKAGYWEPTREGYYRDRLDYEGDYGSAFLAKTRIEFQYAGVDFYINIRVKENSGHYSGSCLDYEMDVQGCNYEEGDFELYDDFTDDTYVEEDHLIRMNVCGREGLTKLQAKNIAKRLKKEIYGAIGELEIIFSRCCQDELCLDWICNYGGGIVGEAGYGHYPKRLWEEREAA